jgi:hypothetical protein
MSWLLGSGTVYGINYRTIAPPMFNGKWQSMAVWCEETFGPSTGSIWAESANTPKPHERWYQNNAKFWFREEKDLTLFILRWTDGNCS